MIPETDQTERIPMYDVYPEVKLVGPMSRAKKLKAYRQIERVRTKYERVVRSQFRTIFADQCYSILELEDPNEREIYSVLKTYDPQMEHVLEWTYTNVARDIYPMVDANMTSKSYRDMLECKATDPLGEDDLYAILIRKWIRENAASKIVGIDEATMREIRNILDGSPSVVAFREALTDLYAQEIVPVRASTIARTETAASSNRASLETVKSLDSARTEMKTWNTALDAAVRDTHQHLESKTIELSETYSWYGKSGYSKMDCPADGTYGAPAGEVINCRCFLTYSAL